LAKKEDIPPHVPEWLEMHVGFEEPVAKVMDTNTPKARVVGTSPQQLVDTNMHHIAPLLKNFKSSDTFLEIC